jgi:quercetin dioxygenase-like cupin family protein
MLKAYKLYTGPDGHSHFTEGTISANVLTEAVAVQFKETAAKSSYDWHTAPTTQYVITLSGTLEFVMTSGKSFIVKPGDVVIAMDTTGSGHKWQLIDDQPWKRIYVLFKDDSAINFIPASQ